MARVASFLSISSNHGLLKQALNRLESKNESEGDAKERKS